MPNQGQEPSTFDDLVGQPALAERLHEQLRQGRVAHAVIIAGPKGAGKRTIANIWARALLCEARGSRPCNQCPPCLRALSGNHPDLHIVTPAEEGKPLGVEDARGIRGLIDVKPYEGRRSVVIAPDAHGMTTQAQNALLKTLEEPPESAVLMLLSETLFPLLPTVLSRCEVWKPARLGMKDMLAVLAARGYDRSARTLEAAEMADGRPGRALALLADGEFWELKAGATEALVNLALKKRVAQAEKFFSDNKQRTEEVLSIWECALRDAALDAAGAHASRLSGSPLDPLKGTGLPALERMLLACVKAREALERNAMQAVMLDNLILEITGGIG